MIWRTSIPWLLIGSMICIALALATQSAEASQGRYAAIKALEGMHERTHRTSLRKRIGVDPARVPWCGYAVAYSVRKAGGKPVKGYPSARSWERFGSPVSKANIRKGDIVTRYSKYSRSKRHVGISGGRVKGGAIVCSGNTSDRVRCTVWKDSTIKAARR